MNFSVASNEYFTLEHCYSCALPGYLIVTPRIAAKTLYELPEAFQQRLGPCLALATELTRQIARPLALYCAQFGEEQAQLHFHVFPRTRAVTRAFLEAFPAQAELIHGPVLLDWARSEYRRPRREVWSIVEPAVVEMRRRVAGDATAFTAAGPS